MSAANRWRARGALALGGALAALLVAPGLARAALLTAVGGTQFAYEAAPGEYNNVVISVKGFTNGTYELHVGHRSSILLEYDDAVCAEDPVLGGVSCPLTPPSFTLGVNLGDGDDRLDINDSFLASPASVARVDGGPGADAVASSTTRVEFSGGAGDDELSSDGRAQRNPPGAPVRGDVFSGGPGIDSNCGRADGVREDNLTITLDGVANDGADGENDNILPDVETICGAWGDDTLIGSAGAQELFGDNGNDTLDGGAGDDLVNGGAHDDRLIGGPGRDSIIDDADPAVASSGNDVIEARDGERDAISCGGGADTVFRDEIDVIGVLPTLCERQVLGLPKIKTKTLRVKRGKLKLKVACPAGGGKCKGKLKVATAKKVNLGGKRRKLTLAKGRYKVPAGKTKSATAKLTRTGHQVVKRTSRLKVKIELRTAAGTKITGKARLVG